mgnify:CR=1 FL=1
MKSKINILYIWTKGKLRLQGVYYEPETKDK